MFSLGLFFFVSVEKVVQIYKLLQFQNKILQLTHGIFKIIHFVHGKEKANMLISMKRKQ